MSPRTRLRGTTTALLMVSAFAFVACARPPSAMPGAISLFVTEIQSLGNPGPKTGRACTTSVLGIFTSGNSGVKAATANGGITQVSAADYSSRSVLGFWGQHCTIVYGS